MHATHPLIRGRTTAPRCFMRSNMKQKKEGPRAPCVTKEGRTWFHSMILGEAEAHTASARAKQQCATHSKIIIDYLAPTASSRPHAQTLSSPQPSLQQLFIMPLMVPAED